MRELTQKEAAIYDARSEALPRFVAEGMVALLEFAEILGVAPPEMIISDPESVLPNVERLFHVAAVTAWDEPRRQWLDARLGVYCGHLFVVRDGGDWNVERNPASRFFLRYVVSGFRLGATGQRAVDPFTVAEAFLAEGSNCSLLPLIQEAERELSSP